MMMMLQVADFPIVASTDLEYMYKVQCIDYIGE